MTHRKTISLFLLAALLLSVPATASDFFTKRENQLNMTGTLNSRYAWQLELSYQHRLLPFVDVGIGAGMLKQWYDDANVVSGDVTYKEYTKWSLREDDYRVQKLYARPYVQVSTPELWHSGSCHFRLNAQAGAMLMLPYESVGITYSNARPNEEDYEIHSTSKGQWVVPFVRPAIEMGIEDLGFSLGAEFSTLDIYSFRRNISFHDVSMEGLYEKKRFSWGVFLNLSYSF